MLSQKNGTGCSCLKEYNNPKQIIFVNELRLEGQEHNNNKRKPTPRLNKQLKTQPKGEKKIKIEHENLILYKLRRDNEETR